MKNPWTLLGSCLTRILLFLFIILGQWFKGIQSYTNIDFRHPISISPTLGENFSETLKTRFDIEEKKNPEKIFANHTSGFSPKNHSFDRKSQGKFQFHSFFIFLFPMNHHVGYSKHFSQVRERENLETFILTFWSVKVVRKSLAGLGRRWMNNKGAGVRNNSICSMSTTMKTIRIVVPLYWF